MNWKYSSKWVRIERGATPLSSKKEGPPTLSSEALLGKKITKNVRKRAKIAKNAKSRQKGPKIGLTGSFERYLSVLWPYKYKIGSKDTIGLDLLPILPCALPSA
jgi:hypothetical protein